MQFKSERITKEWNSGQLDVRLTGILLYLDWYLKTTYSIDLVITQLFRTKEEQRAIYGDVNTPVSVHEHWRGADIRIKDWPEGVPKDVESHLNGVYRYSVNTHHETAFVHDIGHGNHMHLQTSSLPQWRG